MVHFFGLRCMCVEEFLLEQCQRIFLIQSSVVLEEIMNIIRRVLQEERNWCDGKIYEAVIRPLVNILGSRERMVELLVGFVAMENAQTW